MIIRFGIHHKQPTPCEPDPHELEDLDTLLGPMWRLTQGTTPLSALSLGPHQCPSQT